MCIPNFFILGAPKCGTTALARYLEEHPRIAFSLEKETHHFCPDLPGHRTDRTDEEYRAEFFPHVRPHHLAAGEGTPFYLYSQEAIPRIRDYNPEARLVAMLRNPVDLVHSFHAQLLYNCEEDIVDFPEAWRAQEDRRRGQRIPETCVNPSVLQYRRIAALGEQMERLYSLWPAERILPVFFDDFRADTWGVYRRVLAFLGVPDDGRTEFPVENSSKYYRNRAFARLIFRRPAAPVVRGAMALTRRIAGGPTGILGRLHTTFNRREAPRPPLPLELRRELVAAFEPDIQRLEKLLDRDLSSWRALPTDEPGRDE